ncbi:glucose dehydrogenase [FAD, quinone]-like isoform X1 [Bombyx mandarina]|uniref:Glucose dehydrogenase [FAD, quinone]-like isoform X1 n=3 Tax=Bombyx mandarina TaxID=7092 RepID=A0A6J2KQ16_BOMMA|nr:glucose dehydrogenase [FAD, quinone]-like isoform X1 [Bombyx mandarina]
MNWGRFMFRLLLACSAGAVEAFFFENFLQDLPYTYPTGIQLEDGAAYDYVVVGAGAAGAAAASRLALKGFDVMLIEAGGDPSFLSTIPMASLGLLGSSLDWQYKTIPNNISCLSSIGEQCRFSRGKSLGGTTAINHMLYIRGNRYDYDRMNISGWTWKDLEPYFLRYEGLQILDQYPASSRKYHNSNGTMKLEYFDDPRNPWHTRTVEGLKQLNIPFNKDLNGEYQIGVTKVAGYVYKGERMSTARGYLARNDVKKNLKVAKNAFCTEVVIDDDNIARGVTVVQNLQKVTIYARIEIVLSAGTIGTPQILMQSGVGPADHLQEMGISVRSNLPVGNDMSDHHLPVVIVKVDHGGLVDSLVGLTSKAPQVLQYLASRSGPLASNSLQDIVTLINTNCYDFDLRQYSGNSSLCELADMQIIQSYIDKGLVALAKPLVKQAIGFNDQVLDQIEKANENHGLIIFSPMVLQPYSRGTVRLASIDPLQPPAIFANYLGDERDVEQMVKSITFLEHLMKTQIFKKHKASILHLNLPGCPAYKCGRVEYWRCYARHMTYSGYHAVGTCALTRVVDEQLRVYGVKNLRVADLSVLKNIIRGNTASVSIAIGERIVDFLTEEDNP